MTPIQAQVLDVIRRYTAQGAPPSLDEIACEMGWKARSNAHRVVVMLRAKGVVEWSPKHRNSLRIIADGPLRSTIELWSDDEIRRVALDLYEIGRERGLSRVMVAAKGRAA